VLLSSVSSAGKIVSAVYACQRVEFLHPVDSFIQIIYKSYINANITIMWPLQFKCQLYTEKAK
jgi:hypothetical protein